MLITILQGKAKSRDVFGKGVGIITEKKEIDMTSRELTVVQFSPLPLLGNYTGTYKYSFRTLLVTP
jgi:hypothetical protein